MAESIHPASLPVDRLLAACDEERTRRSGPGGQHRNKVETAVILTHRPTGLAAEAGERRSQSENRTVALFRLRIRLAIDVRAIVESPHHPSSLWRSRCREGKVSVNSEHTDFPAILAEGLDVLAARGFDPKLAASELDCTPSQLTKLIQQEPRAMTAVNSRRQQLGLHPLR